MNCQLIAKSLKTASYIYVVASCKLKSRWSLTSLSVDILSWGFCLDFSTSEVLCIVDRAFVYLWRGTSVQSWSHKKFPSVLEKKFQKGVKTAKQWNEPPRGNTSDALASQHWYREDCQNSAVLFLCSSQSNHRQWSQQFRCCHHSSASKGT